MTTKIYDIIEPPTFESLHRQALERSLGSTGVRLVVVERMLSELDMRRTAAAEGPVSETLYLIPTLYDFSRDTLVGLLAKDMDGERVDAGSGRVMRRPAHQESDDEGELMLITLE